MFVRIYSGIIFAALVSISSCYLLYQQIDRLRTSEYTLNLFKGTQQLIKQGINRHDGVKQQQWMQLVEKLIGLPIQLIPISEAPITDAQLKEIDEKSAVIESIEDKNYSQLWTRADDANLLSIRVKNVAEQQLRITAYLLLNELGRHARSKRVNELNKLRQYFHYDINILDKKELQLDSQQSRRLLRGDIVVAFEKDETNQDVLMVYSRYKSTEQYLVIGPILPYNSNPTWLLASLLILALSITGLMIYVLVKTLERRMRRIKDVVVNFGPATLESRVPVDDSDAIGDLAMGINAMATRIQHLLMDQKDITQAISHELRTPISRMKFRLEMLKEKAADPAQKYVTRLNKDIGELDDLVEELLAFQLLDSSHQIENKRIVLNTLTNSLIEEIYEPFESIKLDLTDTNQELKVYGDESQLKRLMQNLLINAFKHAKSKVKIEITRHSITVHDDGEGIPQDQRERIFSPFVRLDSSRNKKTGGFGLGLAIIERIVRLHNANIRVMESPLGGAAFIVTFPSVPRVEKP